MLKVFESSYQPLKNKEAKYSRFTDSLDLLQNKDSGENRNNRKPGAGIEIAKKSVNLIFQLSAFRKFKIS
jgi:hypothetical protein